MHEKIAVGIVFFNPEDENRIHRSLESILNQVEQIYIFDNSTIKQNFSFHDRIIYLTENENKGISYALNRVMERAKSDGYDWLVTMDQDSIMPTGMIEAYKMHLSEQDVGIICPQVIDSRRSYMETKKEPKKEYVEFCITSASCTRISAWEKIGKFDEWLFIDLVDNDFCKRLVVSGYKILQLNELVLNQEFGRIIPKSERVQKFWNRIAKILHNGNFGKLGYRKFVSPMRVYYTCRNIIYVNKKLKKYGKTGYKENYNCDGFPGFLICFVIPSVLRAQNKVQVIKSVLKGMKKGIDSKPKMWSAFGLKEY